LRQLGLRIAAWLEESRGFQPGLPDEALLSSLELSTKLQQFQGIEIEEWSSQIAGVALILAEHQADVAMEEGLAEAPDLLSICLMAKTTVKDNAECDSGIFGGPPSRDP
jgi:hypothetical protein